MKTACKYLLTLFVGGAVGYLGHQRPGVPTEGVPLTDVYVRVAACEWRHEYPAKDYVGIKIDGDRNHSHALSALLATHGKDEWRTYRAVLYPTD